MEGMNLTKIGRNWLTFFFKKKKRKHFLHCIYMSNLRKMDPDQKMPARRKHYSKEILKAGMAMHKARETGEAEQQAPLKRRKTVAATTQKQDARKDPSSQKEKEREKLKKELRK